MGKPGQYGILIKTETGNPLEAGLRYGENAPSRSAAHTEAEKLLATDPTILWVIVFLIATLPGSFQTLTREAWAKSGSDGWTPLSPSKSE